MSAGQLKDNGQEYHGLYCSEALGRNTNKNTLQD